MLPVKDIMVFLIPLIESTPKEDGGLFLREFNLELFGFLLGDLFILEHMNLPKND